MRIFSLIIISLFIYDSSFGQLSFVDDIDISPENYIHNFEQINSTVKNRYSHLKNKKINIDSLFLVFYTKISHSKNKEDYFKYLLNYFSRLNNSHSTIFLRDYGLKASVRIIEKRIFIKKVDTPVLLEAGIEKNDEIIEIDETPSYEWLNMQRKFVSASTPKHELSKASWKVFNSEFKLSRTYKIKTKEGIRTIKLKIDSPADYNYTYPSEIPKCISKKINDSTGYIAINAMTGNVVNEFETAYNKLFKLSNMIIDLRENYGGNSGYSEQITRYLINKNQKACVSRKKLKPHKNSYLGKLYILIGTDTGSAAESFALDLLESGNVILIGSPTAGDTGNEPLVFTTDYGVSFRIPTRNPPQISCYNQFPMEGKGIPPHYSAKQTVEDFEKDIDTVLDYTLNHIRKTGEF